MTVAVEFRAATNSAGSPARCREHEAIVLATRRAHCMKLAGFLLLLAGWVIVIAAVALLASASQLAGFVLAGIGVEALGLILAVRSHLVLSEDRE
jgi:hypothetical protein